MGSTVNNPAPARAVVIVERPDPDGQRWRAALDILLQAGGADPDDECE